MLTAREHYIAHFLLFKHFKKHGDKNQKIKMARAWNAMTFSSNDNIKRYTSHSFAYSRIAFNESIKGENHPFYGKKHTEETRIKISRKLLLNKEWRSNSSRNMRNVRKNVTAEQETRRIESVRISASRSAEWNSGRVHSDDAKKNMSLAALGKLKSDTHRSNISESWQHRKTIACPHCDKSSKNSANMKRYHFDNCKKLTTHVL